MVNGYLPMSLRQTTADGVSTHLGSPVGVKTIAVMVGEEEDTIEDVYEPFLIQIGFIKRTPQGREVTSAAKKHLNTPQKTLE